MNCDVWVKNERVSFSNKKKDEVSDIWRTKNQLDATYYFIVFLIGRKTKSAFCACVITFQTQSASLGSYVMTISFRASYLSTKGSPWFVLHACTTLFLPPPKIKFLLKWYMSIGTDTVRYSSYKYNIYCFLLAVKLYNVTKVVLREISLDKQWRHKSGTLTLVFIEVT